MKNNTKYGKTTVAKTDMETFKVCLINEHNQAVSFDSGVICEKGELVTTDGHRKKGIQSYTIDSEQLNTTPKRLSPCTIIKCIDTVFGTDYLSMSYSRKTHKNAKQAALVYCTIPTGAKYRKSENGDIMSDSLRIDKVKKF